MVLVPLLGGCVTSEGTSSSASASPSLPATSGAPGQPKALEAEPGKVLVLVIDTELVPIVGADVAISPGDIVGTTDETGAFVTGKLEPGNYVVVASKKGYSTKEMAADVTEDQGVKVTLTLDALASDVPYHETLNEAMYLICHMVVQSQTADVTILNLPCAGAVDLLASGTANTLDHWIFFFVVDKPGFQSLAMEMTWDPQQFGTNGLMQLTTLGKAKPTEGSAGVTVDGTVYGGEMGAPFHMVIHAGESYWMDGDEPVIFYPEANATENFQMMIAGGGGNTTLDGTAFFLEFRPTAWLTLFYNRRATHDFSVLPDQ